MGKVGREIIKVDPEELIEELNKGVAAELNDAYRYLLLSKLVSGPRAGELAEMFEEMAQDEWNHMGLLMERILQIGGRPMARPSDSENRSYVAYKAPPEDATDLKRAVEDSLEGERAAIQYWQSLYDKTRHDDPVTAGLAREGLQDEVGDEDSLERFIEGWDS
jgi:bacterioferritin